MINQKFLFTFILLLVTCISSYAQSNPVVYVIWNDTSNLNTNDSLIILDPRSLSEIGRIPLPGTDPFFIELSNDKKTAFVSHSFVDPKPNGMTVIDLETRQIKTTLFHSVVSGMRMGAGNKLYVMLRTEQRMAVINTETLQEETSLPLSTGPVTIAFSLDNKTIYMVTEDNPIQNTPSLKQDRLYIIGVNNSSNTPTFSIKKIIDLETANSLGGNDNLVISPDGKFLYIGLRKGVKVLDTTKMEIVNNLPGTDLTYTLALTKDGSTLYELDFSLGLLQRVNLKNPSDIKFTVLPAFVRNGLKFSQDEKVLYINGQSKLFVFDVISFKPIATYEYPNFIFANDLELAGDYTPGKPPIVNVLSPFSNQIVQKGSSFNITWSTTTDKSVSTSHSIDLSTDGGKTFKTNIASGLPGTTQQFNWQVPANQTIAQAQIKITSVDTSAQMGVGLSGIFSISDKPSDNQSPTVAFSTPMGGETFLIGDSLNINWSSSDNVGITSQDLFLSMDGGATFPIILATGLTASKHAFTLTLNEAMKTDRARLKLTVQDGSGNKATAVTGADFRIVAAPDTQPPTITISQPANSIFSAGQPITVQWQSADNVAVVSQTLLISFDNGQSFQQLSTFDGVANSFVISNIDKFATQAMVKITAIDAAGNKGEKVANFQVAPMLGQATYSKPVLAISGLGFNSALNDQSAMVRIFINDKEIAPTVKVTFNSNSSITVEGNKKKLGLVKGSNSLRLIVNGLNSNSINFVF